MALRVRKAEEILAGRIKVRSAKEYLNRKPEIVVIEGPPGPPGKDGRDGLDGPAGRPGADAKGIRWAGAWRDTLTYEEGDVVFYSGSSFVALVSSVKKLPTLNPTIWQILAAGGSNGANGRDGASSGTLNWIDYASNWDSQSPPTLIGSTAAGDVYQYTYSNGTRYRLVPTDGTSEDAFYTTWNGSALSGLVVERPMSI